MVSIQPSQAGVVELFGNLPESSGTLTLSGKTIIVDNQSTPINLSEVLEANFAAVPLNLKYFSSEMAPDVLPVDWKSQDIGRKDEPGSFHYAHGVLTVTGSVRNESNPTDGENSFFMGESWTGDGEWSMHVQDFEPANPNALCGLVLRDGLDPQKGMVFHVQTSGSGGGSIYKRGSDGGYFGHSPPMKLPIWLRLTHNGATLAASLSDDGKDWQVFIQNNDDHIPPNLLAGVGVASEGKPPAKFHLDHVTFAPAPSRAEVLPSGVLLRSGTFLSGSFRGFDLTDAKTPIVLQRNGKDIPLPAAQISAITFFPTPRKQLAAYAGQHGLLMKNGDFNAGDIVSFQPGDPDTVRISSVQLGIIAVGERFGMTGNQAILLESPQPQAADYEVRLTDGSIVRASDVAEDKGQVQINEVSGVSFTVDVSEIAQLRAGSSRVQNLAELPWKIETANAPKRSSPPVESTLAGAAVQSPAPVADSWEGSNQEQIVSVVAGSISRVALADGFGDIDFHFAVSPHSTPGGQASLRVTAGDKTWVTPILRAGDQPRFISAKIDNPRAVSFAVESTTPGMQVLLIDPVAVRKH